MHDTRGRTSFIGHRSISLLAGALTVLSTTLAPSFTENAVANGDTRTLYLYHTHTREQIAATYLVNGQYDQSVLKQLNWFLRDWRRDEPTTMDPRLFDVVWEAYRQAGANEPINVVSAYRSPETNSMLRRRSRAVAKHSQHMLGKAMDTTMPGMSMSLIREIGMRMQRGGVGYYPTAGTPFVHLDVGSVRSWPRMSYEQLVRLFPDGKTVHLPTNNQPLARYDEARAEIEARGGGAYVPAIERKSKSFLAFLFGGGGEDDEDSGLVTPPPTSRKQWASLAPRGSRVAADGEEEGAAAPPPEKSGRGRQEKLAEAESNLPRGETTLGPGPAELKDAPADRGASAPTPLARSNDRVAVAALQQAPDDAPLEKRLVEAPLPPRRPAGLLALGAPLPPARPTELAALAIGPTGAAPAPNAGGPTGLPARTAAGGAFASLIEVTGTTPKTSSGGAVVRSSGAVEATGAKQSDPVLAYSSEPAPNPGKELDGPAGAHASAAARPALVKSAALRTEILPARLDRSNAQVMTAAIPTSRMSLGSVLGSTLGPRSAARAEPNLFAAAPGSKQVSGFAPKADVLPTDRFVGR